MADLAGKTLGKYQLIERLGRGGMAEVYRAFQPRLERNVAVKVMHGYLAGDDEFVERFEREARSVAALHHHHIVQVFDFDIEDDVYYMVMEYIGGSTLKAILEDLHAAGQRMSLAKVERIFTPLCSALHYAHERGRIHRDIKPANIMFDGDRLVLTDFGIAAIVGGTRLTATGAMVGTPAYMAPEQAEGSTSSSVQSDIYSLGVILYEMVTGQLPYDADTPLAIVLKHINDPLPIPSQIVPDLPQSVEHVILKALAKKPADRYQNALELAQALQDAISKPQTTTQPVTMPVIEQAPPEVVMSQPQETTRQTPPTLPAEQKKKGLPVGKLLFGLGGVAVVVLLIVALVLKPWQRETEQAAVETQPAAERSVDEMEFEVTPVDEMEGDVPATFEEGMHLYYEQGDFEAAVEAFSRAIEENPSFSPAYFQRGVVYYELGQNDLAVADLSRAIELSPDDVESRYLRGHIYIWELDSPDEGLADLEFVVEMAPDFAPAHLDLARYYLWYTENDERAMAELDMARELDPDLPDAWMMSAEHYLWQGNYPLAEEYLQRAAELLPEDPWVWDMLGFLHYKIEDFQGSLHFYNYAVELDPDNLEHLYGRAFAYLAVEEYEAALSDFDRVLMIEPAYSGAHYGRGRVLFAMEAFEEAAIEFEQAANDPDQNFLWPYFENQHPMIDLARAHEAMGESEMAMNDLNSLLEEHPDFALALFQRGMMYKNQGQMDAAMADFQRAWESSDNPDLRAAAENEMKDMK